MAGHGRRSHCAAEGSRPPPRSGRRRLRGAIVGVTAGPATDIRTDGDCPAPRDARNSSARRSRPAPPRQTAQGPPARGAPMGDKNFRLTHDVRPERYDFTVTPDLAARTFAGRGTV